MLDFLWQLGDVILVQFLELVEVALVAKENICFIKDEASKLAKIKLACITALFEVVGEFAERSHDNVVAVDDARLREVRHVDVRILAKLLVDIGNLG